MRIRVLLPRLSEEDAFEVLREFACDGSVMRARRGVSVIDVLADDVSSVVAQILSAGGELAPDAEPGEDE